MASFKKGVFTANAATGDQVISGIQDALGNDFTPVAFFVWGSYQTSAALTDGWAWAIGITDGTRQRALFAISTDNAATSESRRFRNASRFLDCYNTSGTNIFRATIVSFGLGTATINISVADAAQPIFHYLALGGDGVSAFVGSIGADATFVAEAIPFDMVAALLFPVSSTTDVATTGAVTCGMGWVANQRADATWQAGCATSFPENGSAAADTWRYQRTDRAVAQFGTTGAIALEYAYGANLGFLQTVQNDELIDYLALGGIQAYAVDEVQPTSAGNQALTGAPFTPKAALFLSVGTTPQTTPQTDCRMSLGCMTAGDQGSLWIGDLDTADPTVNARRHSTTKVLTMGTPNATGSSSSIEAEAEFESLDADGVTIEWTTADATQREFLALLLGDAAPAPAGDTIAISIQAPAIVFPNGVAGY